MKPWCRLLCPLLLVLASGAGARAQTDSSTLTRPRFSAYPYVFYSPETRLAFGGALVATFRTVPDSATRTSSVTLGAYYSVNRQYNITISPEFFLAGNRQWCTAVLEIGRFVDKFWGIGPNTPEAGVVEFTKRVAHVLLRVQTTVLDRAMAGVILEADQTTIDAQEGGAGLRGSPAPGSAGARSTGVGAGLTWDSRDHVFYPGNGGFYQVETTFFPEFLGTEYAHTRTTVDLRHYLTIGGPHILAFQVYGAATGGTPPLFKLPALGGESMMRGYYQGRFRDMLFATAQAEYRVAIFGRMGMAAFAGIGDVAPHLSSFTMRTLKVSAGLGLRFTLDEEEHLNLRMDWGFGRGTDGLYFGIREAF